MQKVCNVPMTGNWQRHHFLWLPSIQSSSSRKHEAHFGVFHMVRHQRKLILYLRNGSVDMRWWPHSSCTTTEVPWVMNQVWLLSLWKASTPASFPFTNFPRHTMDGFGSTTSVFLRLCCSMAYYHFVEADPKRPIGFGMNFWDILTSGCYVVTLLDFVPHRAYSNALFWHEIQ